jgi:hypothetical protein
MERCRRAIKRQVEMAGQRVTWWPERRSLATSLSRSRERVPRRSRGGRGHLQGKPQPSERGIEPADHLLACHAKHRKSLFLEPDISLSITFPPRRLVMIRAIDLDDQPRFETCKIGDEGADRHLPLEFEAVEPFGAKLAPDQSFNRGLSSPLSFGGGTLAYAYFETCHLCPSAPLPPSLREGTLSRTPLGPSPRVAGRGSAAPLNSFASLMSPISRQEGDRAPARFHHSPLAIPHPLRSHKISSRMQAFAWLGPTSRSAGILSAQARIE